MFSENNLSMQLKNGITLDGVKRNSIGKTNEAIIFNGIAKNLVISAPFYIVQNEENSFDLVINKDAFTSLNARLILKNFNTSADEVEEEIKLPSFLDIAEKCGLETEFYKSLITTGVEPVDWSNL